MNWLSLNPVKGVLAGLSPVYFTINSGFEGLVQDICRNFGFALLALFFIFHCERISQLL